MMLSVFTKIAISFERSWSEYDSSPLVTGRKLNVHKTSRRRPGRLMNVLCTFNLSPVSTGINIKTSLKIVKTIGIGNIHKMKVKIPSCNYLFQVKIKKRNSESTKQMYRNSFRNAFAVFLSVHCKQESAIWYVYTTV